MTNQELINRVERAIEYWEGTMHARILRQALASEDYESLEYLVNIAENEMALQEDMAINV
jgi:hypothetical protein